jgi:hypothetical protein
MNKLMLCLSYLVLPTFCSAQAVEVHQCDGRWTNLPCDVVTPQQTTRKVLTPDEANARSQKESILHRLRMRNIEANRKYEVSFDISSAEELCHQSTSALEVCRKEVERLDEKLDKKINAAALLKQREEKIARPSATLIPSQTTVIIRDRYPVFRRRYDPYNSNGSAYGNGQVIQGQVLQGTGQQIQQNVIIQQPATPPPPPPPPQSSGSSFKNLP